MKIKHSQNLSLLGLVAAQFFGAFNDNAWKIIVFTIATRFLLSADNKEFEVISQVKATEALIIFLVPMLLTSFFAALFSDKFSKSAIIRQTKALECILMGLSALSLYVSPHNIVFPYILLALMGVQSALFSPAKYGIIPELFPYQRLSGVNGTIEMWTMLAIIAGTGLGPILLLADKGGADPAKSFIAPLLLTIFSLIGFAFSFLVPGTGASQKNGESTWKTFQKGVHALRSDRILLLAILGTAFYWGLTSLLGQNVLVYAKALVRDLEKGELLQGLPPASYGIGIAFGALFGGKISRGHIEYGLITLGAIGFALAAFNLGFSAPLMGGTIATLIFGGFAAGMLIIPLQAIIQWRAPVERTGSVIALSNAINVLAMIAGSLLAFAAATFGMTLKDTLLLSTVLVVAATIWALKLLPEALARLLFIILTSTFYKIKIEGRKHIPEQGACLLVANHLSAIDAFLIMAAVDRPIHFLIKKKHYSKWWFKPFAFATGAIPINYEGTDEEKQKSLLTAFALLKRGQIVCMFPEGSVSRTGALQPFKDELGTLLDKSRWPVIPVYIGGVTDTLFSPKGGKYLPRHIQKFPHPVTALIGTPFTGTVEPLTIRSALSELAERAKRLQLQDDPPCHQQFIRFVWRAPWRLACQDAKNRRVSRAQLLSRAIFLARMWKNVWKEQESVFILLPPSVDAAVVNLAAALALKTAINVNYSEADSFINEAVNALDKKKACARVVITSKDFCEKMSLSLPMSMRVIEVDEWVKAAKKKDLYFDLLVGLILPSSLLGILIGQKRKGSKCPAALSIHASKTCKLCALSHQNVLANAESISQVLPSTRLKDKLLHIIPFYDSFGYAAFWTALLHPMPIVFFDDISKTAEFSEIVKKRKPSILFAPPKTLDFLAETLPPGALGSIKAVINYSFSYDKSVMEKFQLLFGIEPLAAFYLTESTGAITTNTFDVRKPGVFQQGKKQDSVGRPLPGVLIKIVDPHTKISLARGEIGEIHVKGAQIVSHYFDTKRSLLDKDGWLNTQKLGFQDERDFLHLY